MTPDEREERIRELQEHLDALKMAQAASGARWPHMQAEIEERLQQLQRHKPEEGR